MTCPRCGAITEYLPCPVCGWNPEETPEVQTRPRRRHKRRARLLAVALGGLLVLGLLIFGASRWLFSGDWNQPDPPAEPDLPAVNLAPVSPSLPDPEPAPDPEPPQLPRYTVVIDPGHGGTQQPGVVAGDLCEKEVNMRVAMKLKALLEQDNIEVVMTRTEDVYLGLKERIMLANGISADCFVSIHCNSYDNEKVQGFEPFYYKSEEGEALAECIRQAAETLGINTRECKSGNYQVLRDAKVPATLVEIGYFTCPAELELLREDGYQDKLAQSIMNGMLAYLDKENGS